MKEVIYTNTGEVKLGDSPMILNSGAIGSCVVITAFDSEKKICVMAHVMLPGECPDDNSSQSTRYAVNSVEEVFVQLSKFDVKNENVEVCIVGGANVLRRVNDSIGDDNVTSVESLLFERQINIQAKSTGGFERRTALFDVDEACLYVTVGDLKPEKLWKKI